MFVKLQCLILFILVGKSFCNNDQCTTTDNVPGRCVPVPYCSIYYEKLMSQNKNILTPNFYENLRENICGFIKFESFVCCASNHVTMYPDEPFVQNNGVLIFASNKPTAPTSVTNHAVVRPVTKPLITPSTNIPDTASRDSVTLTLPIAKQMLQCGPIFTDKLSNGNLTALNEYPWMALLQYETLSGREFRCGGSLIFQNYVLTAAHCVQTKEKLVSVRLGEHNLNTDKDCDKSGYCTPDVQDIDVEEIIVNENYMKKMYKHDIALIRLKTPANIDKDNVKLVCLPRPSENGEIDPKTATVTGWGYTENRNSLSDKLLQVEVPVKPISECQKFYGANINLTNFEVCAGGEKFVDTCYGDSGGPLIYPLAFGKIRIPRYVQLGIVSAGFNKCGKINSYTVYTRVSLYTKWILSNIRD